jgi:hypothetical protein
MTFELPTILLAAIVSVESSNLPNPPDGDGGKSWGPFQISAGVIDDVNSFQRFTVFSKADCYNEVRAELMLRYYLAHYATEDRLGHDPTIEDMARIWNGGPDGWRNPGTLPYWAKIHAEFEQLLATPSTR